MRIYHDRLAATLFLLATWLLIFYNPVEFSRAEIVIFILLALINFNITKPDYDALKNK